MEDAQILAIKATMQSSGWKLIEKELVKKKEEIAYKIETILQNSSCIFDQKAYTEITKLSFEKSIIDTFLSTPLDIINRLDVQM